MEKLAAITTSLFIAANAMAVVSLLRPEWIVNKVNGETKFGLRESCLTFKGQKEVCTSASLPPEWIVTLAFIIVGSIMIFCAGICVFFSAWKEVLLSFSRWMSFVGVILFCFSALIFPFGFNIPEIGGDAYKLPPNTEVGMSYYLFFTSLFFSAMACALSNLHGVEGQL